MKIICSWCGKKLGESAKQYGGEDQRIAHGVCPVCVVGIRAETLKIAEHRKSEENRLRAEG